MAACTWNHNIGRQRQENPGACWPDSLAKLVSFGFHERACLKTEGRVQLRKKLGVNLWLPHEQAHTHTHTVVD